MRQVWTEKVNVSEPSMRCRNSMVGIKTRVPLLLWEKPGGYLSTVLAVSGIEMARARFRRQRGTWERLAPTPVAFGRSGGRAPSGGIREGQSTCAEQAGGPPRISGDVPVMGAERRGRIVGSLLFGQPISSGGAG